MRKKTPPEVRKPVMPLRHGPSGSATVGEGEEVRRR
jgi:hypothetical protein